MRIWPGRIRKLRRSCATSSTSTAISRSRSRPGSSAPSCRSPSRTSGESLDDIKGEHDFLAGLIEQYPDRLSALAAVDPFGGADALAEAERALELGFTGFCFPTSRGGRYPDSAEAADAFALADEKGVLVFLHPSAAPIEPERAGHRLVNAWVGRPYDTGICLSRMLLADTLARLPEHPHGRRPLRRDAPDADRPPRARLRRDEADGRLRRRRASWRRALRGGGPPGGAGGPPGARHPRGSQDSRRVRGPPARATASTRSTWTPPATTRRRSRPRSRRSGSTGSSSAPTSRRPATRRRRRSPFSTTPACRPRTRRRS